MDSITLEFNRSRFDTCMHFLALWFLANKCITCLNHYYLSVKWGWLLSENIILKICNNCLTCNRCWKTLLVITIINISSFLLLLNIYHSNNYIIGILKYILIKILWYMYSTPGENYAQGRHNYYSSMNIYKGTLLSHETRWNTVICHNVDGCWEYHAR